MLIKDRNKGISSITANRLGIGDDAQPVLYLFQSWGEATLL